MGLPRPEWDFQGRNWQVGRKHVPQELGTGRQGDGKRNFTSGDGTSKAPLYWTVLHCKACTLSNICQLDPWPPDPTENQRAVLEGSREARRGKSVQKESASQSARASKAGHDGSGILDKEGLEP